MRRNLDDFNATWGRREGGHYFFWYGHYYAVQAMYTAGNSGHVDYWQPYFESVRSELLALQDDSGLTLFLSEPEEGAAVATCTLTFEVDDVDAKHRELAARGVEFEKAPQKLFWGYGAELRDPDGYLVYLWDEKSMREKG